MFVVEPSGGDIRDSVLHSRRTLELPRMGWRIWGPWSLLSPRWTTTRLEIQRAASTVWTDLSGFDRLGPSPLLRSGVSSGWRVFGLAWDTETVLLLHAESSQSLAINDSLLTTASRHNSLDRAA